jgi:hypothetical protein
MSSPTKAAWSPPATSSARVVHPLFQKTAPGILLSYPPLECVAFPQITQIAACCTLGMRRISRMRTFGAVAAYPKRALFQRLWGYVTTLLASFSSSDKVPLSPQSNEHITILLFPLSSTDKRYRLSARVLSVVLQSFEVPIIKQMQNHTVALK